MQVLKNVSDTLVQLSKVVSIIGGLGLAIYQGYCYFADKRIENKNSVIIERIIVLEEFDRARYVTLVDNVYSLLKRNHTVTQSELEFIIKFRSKFEIDNIVVDKKLDYIYSVYLERTN